MMIYIFSPDKVSDVDKKTGIPVPNPGKIYNQIGWANRQYIEKTIADIVPPYNVTVVLVYPHENRDVVLKQLEPMMKG